MRLSKILFLMLGLILTFSFIGCDNFSLKDALYSLDDVTLTIVNETESIYRVNVKGVEGIYHLGSSINEDYNTIEVQVSYDYNIITLTEITNGLNVRILGRYFDGPYTWVIEVIPQLPD